MSFDIVRGKISKPEQCKQLIDELDKYMQLGDEGTLYLGYPLTASSENAVTIDALLVTKNKGMVAIIFGSAESSKEQLKEEQDSLYYHIDYYLKKHDSLRKGRHLAFEPIVITIVPMEVKKEKDYYFVENGKFIECINKLGEFDKNLYRKLCEVIQKISDIKPTKKRANVKIQGSYGSIIKSIEKEIANLDQWQKKAAYEIPEGPQRIRGLAGSGKTIVLALKAAYLHTQFPDMKIAVTYYTRSLYQQYRNLITNFVKDMSGENVEWDNLDIIHAWGSASESGIYSDMASNIGIMPYNLTSAMNKFGRLTPFEGCCKELLSSIDSNYKPMYDAILIDEAQDMPSSFFRLVYLNAKKPKRIVWAYDELQNLSEVEMPSLEEMFGVNENGDLNISLESSDDEAKRDIILPICYRNPPWTLALAHALGFGLYRKPVIQMFDNLETWKEIGYTVKGGRLKRNNTVKLSRKNAATPTYFEECLTKEESIYVNKFDTTEKQYTWIADEIKKNIEQDELDPDDILVVFPDTYTAKRKYQEFSRFLVSRGIKSVLAGVDTDRDTFRMADCITCSHIYRAKGNEAPMVYIANADFCGGGLELIKLRNILFTAITRSRAWVRICGVGEEMETLEKEIKQCIENDFELHFKIPTVEEMKKARSVNRERTEEEKERVEQAKANISELIKQVQKGEVEPELLPELSTLLGLLNNNK